MTVSSRTPEGFPARCPLCSAVTNLEFSEPTGDAPCPSCGHLIWLSTELLAYFQRRFAGSGGIAPDRITVDTSFSDLGLGSIDEVELIMELEEEFGISIPADETERLQTVGDAIRYIQRCRRARGE